MLGYSEYALPLVMDYITAGTFDSHRKIVSFIDLFTDF